MMSDNPFIKDVRLVRPPVTGQDMSVVLLDRIEPGVTPEYCVHGKATCYGCDEWCWLGDKTYDVVASGEAVSLCLQCAETRLPAEMKAQGPSRRIADHRRADGPHHID